MISLILAGVCVCVEGWVWIDVVMASRRGLPKYVIEKGGEFFSWALFTRGLRRYTRCGHRHIQVTCAGAASKWRAATNRQYTRRTVHCVERINVFYVEVCHTRVLYMRGLYMWVLYMWVTLHICRRGQSDEPNSVLAEPLFGCVFRLKRKLK